MMDHSPSRLHRRIIPSGILILSLILPGSILIDLTPASPSSTIFVQVDTLVDSSEVSYQQCTILDPEDCSLRGAIIVINSLSKENVYHVDLPAGKITLAIGGKDEDNAQTGDLDIKNNIEIHGNPGGSIIDANHLDRVFDQIGGSESFKLESVTISGGSIASGAGGGLRSDSDGLLSILHTIITGNEITGSTLTSDKGGGLYYNGGDLYMNDVVISGNDACDGGGIYLDGNSSNMWVGYSTISDNTASCVDSVGGMNVKGSGMLGIYNTDIEGNIGDGVGGLSVITTTPSISFQFINLSISDNTADNTTGVWVAGGAVLDADGTIQNAWINNNQNITGYVGGLYIADDRQVTMEDSVISNNSATSNGGGVYSHSSPTFRRVAFIYNSAHTGGGIFINTTSLDPSNFENCTFAENHTSHDGAAIYAYDALGGLNLSHTTFFKNRSDQTWSGAIDLNDTPMYIGSSILSHYGSTYLCSTDSYIISRGYNIATDDNCDLLDATDFQNVDPLLGNLTTWTVPLLPGSLAIDSCSVSDPLVVDQRGFPRNDGDGNGSVIADRGAVEFLPFWIYLTSMMK